MSTSTPGDGASQDLSTGTAPPGAEDDAVARSGSVGDPPAEPDPVAKLEAERADLKERLLRSLADTENLRRRTERDVADARTYAVTAFARDMLNVADNIRRGLESVSGESAAAEGALKTLVDGIELTERDLLKTLERHGVKRLDPVGLKFDPNMHQAMFEVPDETVPAGTVKQVVQVGYAIGERVLRPALVGVAKGGPKAAPAPAASESEAAPGA